MSAGYSKRPLVEKLGMKDGMKVAILNAPQNYMEILGYITENIDLHHELTEAHDFIQFFTKQKTELESEFPELKQALSMNGVLWISWPKRASKVETDLDGNIVRHIGLSAGLVDVKVCAVDKVWSGLKFVYRLKDRM